MTTRKLLFSALFAAGFCTPALAQQAPAAAAAPPPPPAWQQGKSADQANSTLHPFAANLSNADLNDLAAYFSAQPHAAPAHVTAPEVAAAGRRIAEQNNCVACHARTLMGQQHIPRLAGQQADYLRTQLRGFKASTRFNMDGNMTSAAQGLSDADIDTLADYLSGLGAP